MQIKKMTEEYISEAAEIEAASFSEPRSAEAFMQELKLPYARYLYAENAGIFAGYIGMRITDGEAYISNVAVKNEYKRQGIGFALITAAQRQAEKENCRRLLLEVRASNAPAIRLYEKAGFKNLGTRRRMYNNPPEDGYVYELILSK